MNNQTGSFETLLGEAYELVLEITCRGNDAEIRRRYDGTYDVFELEKKRPKLRGKQNPE
ncbi:MAG: hypothetical protein IKE08_01870 [Clostridia bacterium]|nr:hypothetical protein [Clostridia bacterium]MBR0388032.1 hypothetical protein [Clostridia bacterium]MBR2601420.1 hypothetical protein [Clostridia bacterium]MBR7175150.1 hypothetical protein [Clostridia bacterium]